MATQINTDPGCTSPVGWYLPDDVDVTGGQLVFPATGLGRAGWPGLELVEAGKLYYYEIEIVEYVSGSIYLIIGDTESESFSGNGIYKGYITAQNAGDTGSCRVIDDVGDADLKVESLVIELPYEVIDVGSAANDGTGDTAREGGIKINNNFDETFDHIGTVVADTLLNTAHAAVTNKWNQHGDDATGGGPYSLDGDLGVTGTATLGGLRLSDTSWDDLKFPATASRIDSASTRYSIDTTDLGIQFDLDARHVEEQVNYVVQLPHAWKEGTSIYPHIHWIQTTAQIPNWLIQYRIYNNGVTSLPAWSYATISSNAFTWTAGDVLPQISSFGAISMTGKTLSCLMDIKLWRDVANGAGQYVGAEGTPVDVLMKEFDIHYEIDSLGSNTEFNKGT